VKPDGDCHQRFAEEGVSFQAVKTYKTSTDPDYEAKKNRVLELYAIADGTADPGPDDPTVVICINQALVCSTTDAFRWLGAACPSGRSRCAVTRRRRPSSSSPQVLRPTAV
jgi:hypothetical protein